MTRSLENRRVLLKASRFDVVEVDQMAADGSKVTWQVILHPGSVVILPLVDRDRVCLIRNERVAVGKSLIELPAGTLDRIEDLRAAAQRELREETGFTARQWRELPGFFMSPGILRERMHLFVAEGLTAGDPERETGEEIDNLVVPWDEALAMVESGQIEDAKTICGILLWDRLRNRLSR